MNFNGLGFLSAALPLSLSINSTNQVVGGKPVFTVIGAPPGATVFWSSYKDNKATGEYNSGYGQVVESNGTAELEGGAWTESDIGIWTKEVLIQAPDGTNNRAMVQFRVSAAPAAPGNPAPSPAGNFLSDPLFYLGDFPVTPVVAGIGGVALYFLTKKR